MRTYELDKGWSDWVKLGAAVLVAVSHYSTVIVINHQWSDSAFMRFWCQGAYIGVALFFFLSGYGLMESDKKRHLGLKDFFTKRFLKVYLPVVMISVVWIPLYYGIVLHDFCSLTLRKLIYDVFWEFQDPVLWFVKILFILYGLFWGFSWLKTKGQDFLAHIFMILGTVVTVWCAIECSFPFISIPLFTIGLYSSLLKERALLGIPSSIWMLGIMTVICTIIGILNRSNIIAHGALNSIVVSVILAGIYVLKIPPILMLSDVFLSANLFVYLVHMKVLVLMIAIRGFIPFWSWALATVAATIVFTYLKKMLKI